MIHIRSYVLHKSTSLSLRAGQFGAPDTVPARESSDDVHGLVKKSHGGGGFTWLVNPMDYK